MALLRGKGASHDEHEPAEAAAEAVLVAPAAAESVPLDNPAGTFINPVCGMAVSIVTALHVIESSFALPRTSIFGARSVPRR